MPIGSPVTLAELKAHGRLVRWQDVEHLPNGYLTPDTAVDLWMGNAWQQVPFVRMEGTPEGGDRRIVYRGGDGEKTMRYDWYHVAPAGRFAEWNEPRPAKLAEATLTNDFEEMPQGHAIHSQTLVRDAWPYLTFKVESYHSQARWVENFWTREYTIHASDPRVRVPGVKTHGAWFNTTIAVSHRWLGAGHPDPDGVQYRELLDLSDALGLHDAQRFLIDYCSLPQSPRTDPQAEWFRENLAGFQQQFQYVTIVLNSGAADYATRAWCMLELMLAAMSRASSPTLLNHDSLSEPLHDAQRLALRYLAASGWNRQQLLNAFGRGVTTDAFARWSRDPLSIALYNDQYEGKDQIRAIFEKELALTDENDRPIVLQLLDDLAFSQM